MSNAVPPRSLASICVLVVAFGSGVHSHPHDPGYLRRAGERLASDLLAAGGKAALERACVRLCGIALETLRPLDPDAARRVALETIPAEIVAELGRGGLLEETGELIYLWGQEAAPSREQAQRIQEQSLATFQVMRRLRARLRRQFRDAREIAKPALPLELTRELPGASPATIESARRAWVARHGLEIDPPPVASPIQRLDEDGDGYCELRLIDLDLDGRFDRHEVDLDGDRIFETLCERNGLAWAARDTTQGRIRTSGPAPAVKAAGNAENEGALRP